MHVWVCGLLVQLLSDTFETQFHLMHDYMAILRGIISQLAGVLWLSPFKTTKSHPEYHMVSFISYYMLYIYIYMCILCVYPRISYDTNYTPGYPIISRYITSYITWYLHIISRNFRPVKWRYFTRQGQDIH